jgi:hypothetical protein
LKRYLLVDYENINLVNAGRLDAGDLDVWVFVGPNQKNLPIETVKSLLPLGDRTRIIEISRQGKNSLDFHICYELGVLSRETPKPAKVFVLSNDKGYEPIVEYARKKGLAVERVANLSQVGHQRPKTAGGSLADLIVASLQRIDGKSRPRKKGTLRSYLANQLPKVHTAKDISLAIDHLLSSGRLAEEKGTLKYDV